MFSIFSDAARLPPEIPNNFIFQFDYQVTDRLEIEIGEEIGEFIFVSDQTQSTTEKKPLKPIQQKTQKQLKPRNTQKKTSNNKKKQKHKLTTKPKQTELKKNDSQKPSNINLEKTEPERIIEEKTQPRKKLEPRKLKTKKRKDKTVEDKTVKAKTVKDKKTDQTDPESRMTEPTEIVLNEKKERKNKRSKKSSENEKKQRALLLKKEWLNKILSNGKIWEIRGSNTRIRGKIFLAFKNHIYGEAIINQSIETNKEELETLENKQKHQINESALYEKYKKIYRWVLSNVKKYVNPIQFTRKKGQVVWCVIDDEITIG